VEFLTFDAFVSIPILMVAYYGGVLLIPLLAIANRSFLLRWIRAFEGKFPHSKVRLFLLLGFFFIVFQVIWRMMFETIIGYFQMREYLQQLAG